MSDPFILGLDPQECDGVYPRTRDGRCQGCGVVGEHPAHRRSAREVWVMHGLHGDCLLSEREARAGNEAVGDSVCRYVPAASAVRAEWEAETRGMEMARRLALQMAAETMSEEALRAYENLAKHLEFEIGRRGK